MAHRNDYEYIVIGLGALGSAAAYWLSRRSGAGVLGLEQYEIGHDKGASEDHSRIIRLTYHTPQYVALAHHAFSAWRDLEEESSESLLRVTGDLLLGPRQSVMPVDDYVASLAAAGTPFDLLDAAEIMYRWPQFRLEDDIHGSFQAEGGIVAARKGVLAHARLARANGATLRENVPVIAITPREDGVEVVTSEETYRARRLVVAADAWTNTLLAPLGIRLPLTLMEEQVSYFATPHLDEFQPDRFPVWIWADEPNFYGIPVYGETAGVKAAQDMAGREMTLETRSFTADPATLQRVAAFLQRTIPRAHGPILYSKTCVSTLTPDRDFVVDTIPDYPQIILALGAGHGYKFAGLIGHILSDLAIDSSTTYDIAPFSLRRPALQNPDPPKNFLLRRQAPAGSMPSIRGV